MGSDDGVPRRPFELSTSFSGSNEQRCKFLCWELVSMVGDVVKGWDFAFPLFHQAEHCERFGISLLGIARRRSERKHPKTQQGNANQEGGTLGWVPTKRENAV